MPPIIGGKTMPYDSGQSGTARPEPVDVTIAPAKMRNSVEAATNFVKRRSQIGVMGKRRYTSSVGRARRLRGEPFLEIGLRIDEELAAHAVVAEAAELRTADLPLIAVRGADRREVNGHELSRNR